MLGDKTGGGFMQEDARRHRHPRLQDDGVPAAAEGQVRLGRRHQGRRRRQRAHPQSARRRRPRRRSGASRDLRDARVLVEPHRRDRRRHRQHRSRHALGLRLGRRAVRDLGRDRRAEAASTRWKRRHHAGAVGRGDARRRAARASTATAPTGTSKRSRRSRSTRRRATSSSRPMRKKGGVVFENDGASLYDLGDGVACLELHTKMNAIDADIINADQEGRRRAEKQFDGAGRRQPRRAARSPRAPTSSWSDGRAARATGRRSSEMGNELQNVAACACSTPRCRW